MYPQKPVVSWQERFKVRWWAKQKVPTSGQVLMVWKLRFCLSLVSDVPVPCRSIVSGTLSLETDYKIHNYFSCNFVIIVMCFRLFDCGFCFLTCDWSFEDVVSRT